MDYLSLCRDEAEKDFYQQLMQMSSCDYAKYHYLYQQAANEALFRFQKMLKIRAE